MARVQDAGRIQRRIGQILNRIQFNDTGIIVPAGIPTLPSPMFLGHFAAAMAARAAAPRVSLGMLFIAAQFVDLLWPLFLLAGIEHVRIDPGNTAFTPLDFEGYPLTHSLAMAPIWGLALGGVYWMTRKNVRDALIVGALVVSHWFLDVLVHRPDLPLTPAETTFAGLGIWNSIPATLALEGVLFAAGVALYARVTQARNRAGRYGLWGLVAFLGLIYMANAFGPPPPSAEAIAWAGHAMWLLVLLAFWVDANRADRRERVTFGVR